MKAIAVKVKKDEVGILVLGSTAVIVPDITGICIVKDKDRTIYIYEDITSVMKKLGVKLDDK